MKSKLQILALVCGSFPVFGVAKAESVCDVVLKTGAISVTDFESISHIITEEKNSMCRSTYKTQEEANSAVTNFNAKVPIKKITAKVNYGKEVSSNKFSLESEEFCQMSDAAFESVHLEKERGKIATSAIEAWKECVKSTDSEGVWVEYSPTKDGLAISGAIYIKPGKRYAGRPLNVGINSVPSYLELNCRIGDADVVPNGRGAFTPNTVRVSSAEPTFQCSRKKNTSKEYDIDISIYEQMLGHTQATKVTLVGTSKISSDWQRKLDEKQRQISQLTAERDQLKYSIANLRVAVRQKVDPHNPDEFDPEIPVGEYCGPNEAALVGACTEPPSGWEFKEKRLDLGRLQNGDAVTTQRCTYRKNGSFSASSIAAGAAVVVCAPKLPHSP